MHVLDCSEEDLIDRLAAYDEAFNTECITPCRENNLHLRFVATLVVHDSSVSASIQPKLVSEDHFAYRSREDEIAIAFTTAQQFANRPLVLNGSGTGKAASASGVIRDMLKVVQQLRGN